MKEIWTKNLKKALIWLSGYLGIVAFAIVGGYTIVKSKDDELKKTAKWAFIVTLIFTAISAFLSLYSLFAGFSPNYSSYSDNFYKYMSRIVAIAQIIVYAVFIIVSLIPKKDKIEITTASEEDENK